MIYEIIINLLESICIFLFISLTSWKNTKDIDAPFWGIRLTLSIFYVVLVSNLIQFSFNYAMPNPIGKTLSIFTAILLISLMFYFVYGGRTKFAMYLICTLFAYGIILCCDIIILAFLYLISKDIPYLLENQYAMLCIIATAVKYIALVITILIIEPKFFKNLFTMNRDKPMHLLASTITFVATTKARSVSWLWFYNPRTPKKLRK